MISKRKFFTIDAKAPYEMTCAAHLSFNRYIQERKLPAAFNPAAPFYSLDKYEFFYLINAIKEITAGLQVINKLFWISKQVFKGSKFISN